MKNIQWFVGCSGFAYREWKEVFYPAKLPQKEWFPFYTKHFNTLELNVTFYRFPTIKSLQGWYEKAPEHFLFSTKVPRSITHFKKLQDTERMLADFYGLLAEGLKEKLGCVLFQMPPQFTYSEERLELLINAVNKSFNNVAEFRHESWWRKDVQTTLKKHDITFSGVSFPKIENDNAVLNVPLCYYRFHGVPRLFYSEYDEPFLDKIVDQIKNGKKIKKAFIYFNNTASTAALNNARYIKKILSKELN